MEAFSDADIDDPEIASVGYDDPEPMSESAWARAVASAVGGEQASADDAEPFLEPGDAALGFDGWYPADGGGADHAPHADHADAPGDDAPTGET